MDKCWFVLRQTHYPPPTEPTTPGGRKTGPICLGYIVPSLKGIDEVINTSGPEPFPNNMPEWPSKQWLFKWNDSHGRDVDFSANVEVPTVMAPVNVKADAGLLFKRSVKNHWAFDRLDTTIIQPTTAYIDDTLEDPDVAAFVARKRTLGVSSWAVFMVSGLMIARGAKRESSTSKETGVRGGAGATVPGVVDDGVHVDVKWSRGDGISFERATDFVWAVRFTKISKGMLSEGWTKETFVKGATFNLPEEMPGDMVNKAQDVLGEDGVGDAQIYQDGEDMFVMLDELESQ